MAAGDSTKIGKARGFARVATAPITGGAKAVGKFINPQVISNAKLSHEKSIERHKEDLNAKFYKHQNRAKDYKAVENNSHQTTKSFKKTEKIKLNNIVMVLRNMMTKNKFSYCINGIIYL